MAFSWTLSSLAEQLKANLPPGAEFLTDSILVLRPSSMTLKEFKRAQIRAFGDRIFE